MIEPTEYLTNYELAQLDKALKKRIECVANGKKPPPQLDLKHLADKFSVDFQDVLNRLRELDRT